MGYVCFTPHMMQGNINTLNYGTPTFSVIRATSFNENHHELLLLLVFVLMTITDKITLVAAIYKITIRDHLTHQVRLPVVM